MKMKMEGSKKFFRNSGQRRKRGNLRENLEMINTRLSYKAVQNSRRKFVNRNDNIECLIYKL